MLIEHRGKRPVIHETALVAPTAVVSGDVVLGPDVRVFPGAVIGAEDGRIEIGKSTLIMEHAVLRASRHHAVTVGEHTLIGPHAHVSGAWVGRRVFVATGVSVFNGARVGDDAVVRVGAVVQVDTEIEPGTDLPIGWIAIGRPARLFAPSEGEACVEALRAATFARTVFAADPSDPLRMERITSRWAQKLAAHAEDRILDEAGTAAQP